MTEPVPVARLLRPRSIAIVGASPEPTSIGGGVLGNLEAFGYAGAIHLVSRSKSEIRGRPCLPSIDDLPDGVDVVVLIVPQAAVDEAIAACVRRRAGSVIVYSSGFAEAGEDGRVAQEKLAATCRAAGLPLMGPNCMGHTNYVDGIPLTFEPVEPRAAGPGPRVAVLAQSGATAANIRFSLHARGIGVSHVVATGNEAVVATEDVLAHLIEEADVAAVAVYVEQLRDPPRFLAVAARARDLAKPIVMLHPGHSTAARDAAQSHTGALAGDHAAMRTVVRDAGVALVDTIDELFDVTAVLARFPVPPPGRAAVVTNSGAIRGLAFDGFDRLGLPLATPTADTLAALRALLPPYVPVDNPLDIGTTGFATPSIFGTSLAAMLADPGVGTVLLAHAGGSPKQQVIKADAILPVAATAGKPVLLNIVGDDFPLDPVFMERVRASGIPFFRSTDRAMRAMAAVASYSDALSAAAARAPVPPVALPLPVRGTVPEHRAKAMLADLGLRVPRGILACDEEAAVRAAADLDGPVVLKAQAADLPHKSDAGGVLVGLAGEAAVRAGWRRLVANVAAARPGLALDGVLVEAMGPPGLEMVVGARRDPQWGPVILVGLGGVWIEALGDVVLLPAHATKAEVVARLAGLKAARLLGAFRGAPARDVDAVAAVAVRLGALMRGTPDLLEVDVNPLVVHAAGDGATALDALFVTAA